MGETLTGAGVGAGTESELDTTIGFDIIMPELHPPHR